MSEKEKENFVNEIMNFVNEQPDPQKSLDDVVNVLKKLLCQLSQWTQKMKKCKNLAIILQ